MADVEWVLNEKALEELLRSPAGPTGKLLKQVGTRCVRIAKRMCPVDTGRLRSSIAEELRTDGRDLSEIVGTDVEYAPYVELGTRRMRAQPFLRPAAEQAKP